MDYRILALVVVALVAGYGLRLYHIRRGVELDQRHAKHHGWEKRTLSIRQEVWVCPRCRTPLFTWSDVNQHQSAESPCGVLEDKQADAARLEQESEAATLAQAAGRWSASAVYDNGAETGAVDTFAGELGDGTSDD